jgi:hypothetical protein
MGAPRNERLPLGLGRDSDLVEGGGAGLQGVAGQGGQVEHKPARPPSGSSSPMPASPGSAAQPKHRSTSSTRPAHSPVPAQRARVLHGARAPGLKLLRIFSVAQASRLMHAIARLADLQKQGKVADADNLADRSLFT